MHFIIGSNRYHRAENVTVVLIKLTLFLVTVCVLIHSSCYYICAIQGCYVL